MADGHYLDTRITIYLNIFLSHIKILNILISLTFMPRIVLFISFSKNREERFLQDRGWGKGLFPICPIG